MVSYLRCYPRSSRRSYPKGIARELFVVLPDSNKGIGVAIVRSLYKKFGENTILRSIEEREAIREGLSVISSIGYY